MISTASTSATSAASSGIVRPDHRLQAGDSRRVRGASAVTGKASPAATVGDRASAREPAGAGQAAEDGVGYLVFICGHAGLRHHTVGGRGLLCAQADHRRPPWTGSRLSWKCLEAVAEWGTAMPTQSRGHGTHSSLAGCHAHGFAWACPSRLHSATAS